MRCQKMEDISYFAEGGYSTGDIRWEPYLEQRIQEYIEEESVLRNYVFVYPLPQNTFTIKIPRNYPTGMAVEISEGSEIPRVRQPTDMFELSVVKYGTGGEMTDEAKETDWLGILGDAQIQEAARRMLRKETADIINVMLAGYGTAVEAQESGTLAYEDVVRLKTLMIKANASPDVLFVSPDEHASLLIDDRFVDVSASGSDQTLREGVIGRVSGLDVVMVPELPSGTAIMMETSDSADNPVWLVERQDVKIERDRDPERQVDMFFLTAWKKPVVIRPLGIGLIQV